MKALPEQVIDFFHRQSFVVVNTVDADGTPHSSCKGIIKLNQNGRIYLLDVYKAKTYENIKRNHRIAITAVDEHRFCGFCLKGKAKIIKEDKLSAQVLKAWEKRLTKRITQRVLRNMAGQKGHSRHPETLLPNPEYLVVMQVEEIVDLTPHQLK